MIFKLIFELTLVCLFPKINGIEISTNQLNIVDKYLDMISQRQTNCARMAIQDILPDCEQIHENQEKIHLKYAIQLSICEFQNAHIEYPVVCDSTACDSIPCDPGIGDLGHSYSTIDSSLEICSRTLESKPQWWTTFSNNYRSIGQICMEYRLEYEKDEKLKEFENYLKVQREMIRHMNEMIRDNEMKNEDNNQVGRLYEEFLIEIELRNKQEIKSFVENNQQLEKMNDLVENLGIQLNHLQRDYKDQMMEFNSNLEIIQSSTLTRQKDISKDIEIQLVNWIKSIQLAHTKSSQLNEIISKSKEISLDLLNDTEQSAILAKSAKDVQNMMIGNIVGLSNKIRYFNRFIQPLIYFLIAIISSHLLRRYLVLLVVLFSLLGFYRFAMGLVVCHGMMNGLRGDIRPRELVMDRRMDQQMDQQMRCMKMSKKYVTLY